MELLVNILFNLTFAVHYSFVILVTGIPLWAILESISGKHYQGRAWEFLKSKYPVCISLLMTTSIAPLLFNQFIYHQNFYQTFVNLNPWPLIGLIAFAMFFYSAYLVQHTRKWAFPLVLLQVALLVSFLLFFSTLFMAINQPQNYVSDFWEGKLPMLNWFMVPIHFGLAFVGAGIFLFMRKKHIVVSSIILLLISAGMAFHRDYERAHVPAGTFSKPMTTVIDPAFFLFAVFLVVLIVALLYVKRLVR